MPELHVYNSNFVLPVVYIHVACQSLMPITDPLPEFTWTINLKISLPYETYLYGTKFGDFWKKCPYFRTTKIVAAISKSHTLIFM